MSYNPYAAMADNEGTQTNRLHQPQPQRSFVPTQQQHHVPQQQPFNSQFQHGSQETQYQQPQYQQQQQQQHSQFFNPSDANAYTSFFNDPKTSMTFQVGQNAMLAGSQFVGQEFSKFVPTSAIRAYFKVSNSYVLSKLLLILCPFFNKNWMRSYKRSESENSNSTPQTAVTEQYSYPLHDTNAPDLYIPIMGLVTYILLRAVISGLKDDFHPEVFGLESSSTLAYLFLDWAILIGGLYMLNISYTTYDLIAYSGYKFVPAILIIIVKRVSSFKFLNWVAYLYLLAAYGFFELRAIRFNLFGGISNSTQTMSSKTIKSSNYFFFVYAFIVQAFLLYLLS